MACLAGEWNICDTVLCTSEWKSNGCFAMLFIKFSLLLKCALIKTQRHKVTSNISLLAKSSFRSIINNMVSQNKGVHNWMGVMRYSDCR